MGAPFSAERSPLLQRLDPDSRQLRLGPRDLGGKDARGSRRESSSAAAFFGRARFKRIPPSGRNRNRRSTKYVTANERDVEEWTSGA
jgi:hypothetical protein